MSAVKETYCCTLCQPELCWPESESAVHHVQYVHNKRVDYTNDATIVSSIQAVLKKRMDL